jgi:hypothetical protein
MHRKLICLGLLLALLLSGCSATQEAEQEEPTETISAAEETPAESTEPVETEFVETETPEVSVEPVEEETAITADSYCQFIPAGETCQADLDGDGTLETICYTLPEEGEYGDGTITVNDTSATIFVEEPSDVYCLVDIYGDGSVQLIGVEDYATDLDHVVNFYRYDKEQNALVWLNEMPGLLSSDDYGMQSICTGDGKIQTYHGLNILQSWYAAFTWSYTDGELTEEEQDVYEVYDILDGWGIDVTTLCGIVAFSDMSLDSDTRMLPVGSKLHLLGTDNAEWVEFEVQGTAEVLWFHLVDGDNVQTDLNGGSTAAYEALDNLCYAG